MFVVRKVAVGSHYQEVAIPCRWDLGSKFQHVTLAKRLGNSDWPILDETPSRSHASPLFILRSMIRPYPEYAKSRLRYVLIGCLPGCPSGRKLPDNQRSRCEARLGMSLVKEPAYGLWGVDNVHTFHLGLPRTTVGLPRIPHVSATSQCLQGLESRSSPTSGTASPLVRGGFAFKC